MKLLSKLAVLAFIWWITCGSNYIQYNYVGDDNQIHYVRVSTTLWD